MLYECLLLLGVLAGAFLTPHILIGLVFHKTLPGWVLIGHFLLVWTTYFIWYWNHSGQTLAMQTWKLRLVDANGAKPGIRQLWIRYLLSWPCLLLSGIGILWAVLDRDRQFLQDRIAGTRIVQG